MKVHRFASICVCITLLTISSVVLAQEQKVLDGKQTDAQPSRFAIFGGVGRTIPQGSFGNRADRGLSWTFGLELLLSTTYSVEIVETKEQFHGKFGGPDIEVTVAGLNARAYMNPQSPRAFALAGVHSYAFDPGSTRLGVSLGAGVDIDIAPRLSLEGRYEFHNVTNNAPNTSFSNINLGLRLLF